MSAGISSNPAARLPYTWYGRSEAIPLNVDYNMENKTYRYVSDQQRQLDILYHFGYGLSYSRFHYDNLVVPAVIKKATLDDDFTVKVTVNSYGPFAGTHVLYCFLSIFLSLHSRISTNRYSTCTVISRFLRNLRNKQNER